MAIEKRMSAGGPDEKQIDMQRFIQMADQDKIEFDLQEELFRAIEEKFREQRKPGESFNNWLKRTPVEELRRIELKGGGDALKALLNYFAKEAGKKGSDQLRDINPKALPSGIANIMGPEHLKMLRNNKETLSIF